jgi:transposase-like protein/ribosomal protein L37AE/L43A
MKCKTVKEFFKLFPNDGVCLDHIMQVTYGKQSECPKCKKQTKFHRVSSQRAYVCQFCGHHVYPCVGTPFHNSRTSLQSWFYAIYLFTTTRNGVSAKELERQLGVTYKCAWRMGHEIRKYMAQVDGEDMLSGIVEIDETLIGGKRPGKRGRGAEGKTVVFGMMEKDGDIMTHVVPNVKAKTLKPIIKKNVEKGTQIQTDELRSYQGLEKDGYDHDTVNHGEKQYVDGDTHVNSVEGFWGHLKKGISSTHIHVSKQHLAKYAKEFEYRYNSRKNPAGMLPEFLNSFCKPS